MTAASPIASLLAPAATSSAGRSVASPADPASDTSFEALLREAQAGQNTGTNEADAARNIAAATFPMTPPAADAGTSPITPVQVPPPEALLPPLPAGSSTDQPPAAGTAPQLQPPATVIIPEFLPVVAPVPVAADPASAAQGGPMPATTAAAVQAQVLASQREPDMGVAPAASLPATRDMAQASPPSGDVPVPAVALNNAIDDGQLAQLAALAQAPGKAPASELPKSPRQAHSPASAADGVKAVTDQPIQPPATQPQAAVQGSGSRLTNDPLQQVSAASPDAKSGAETPSGTTPPATAANFAVELKHATQAPVPHGATPIVQVPLDALAVNIARKVEQGLNQFEISLTPAELGKLDISLKIGDDGRVHAVLRAERQDTLDLLRQDARTLENQLRQAGLDVGSNALSFQLSQGQGHKYKTALTDDRVGQAKSLDERSADAVATTFIASRRHDGVDIHV